MPNMAPNLSTTASAHNPKLLDRVRDVLRRKHYSFRTEQTYTDWIRRFILFHGKRHPKEMAEAKVGEFLTHLARNGKVSPSTPRSGVQQPCRANGLLASAGYAFRVRCFRLRGKEFANVIQFIPRPTGFRRLCRQLRVITVCTLIVAG